MCVSVTHVSSCSFSDSHGLTGGCIGVATPRYGRRRRQRRGEATSLALRTHFFSEKITGRIWSLWGRLSERLINGSFSISA